MSKLLWHTNAPWAPTGYGAQARLFGKPLAQNYDLAISAFYGLEGARLNWEGIQVFPGLGGDFGNGSIIDHAQRWFGGKQRDGLVLTLLDVWVLHAQMAAQLDMACWVPVDHDPAPPAVKQFFIESGATPIAMSRFGQEQLEQFNPLYVPHGVDPAFQPYSKKEARASTGVDEDAFLIGMVAANKGRPSRKSFQEALQAFSIFRQSHENAQLYLHTIIDPNHAQGEDLGALMGSLQLPEGSVLLADQYRMAFNPLPANMMARVYATFDVLLNPSQGEGFGVPILEAQACGVPVIATDFSAMKEVTGAGWKVGCRPFWTGQKSWQAIPDLGDIVGALEECYDLSLAKRGALSTKAVSHAENYSVERVMADHFLPALQEVEERVDARKPVELSPLAA